MAQRITTDVVDRLKETVAGLCVDSTRALAHLRYADIRLDVTEDKAAAAENGGAKLATDDYACAVGVRVIAGERMAGPGYAGRALGAADLPELEGILREALARAYRRARANGDAKARAREHAGGLGLSLVDTHLAPVRPTRAVVPAVHGIDPRGVALDDVTRLTNEVAREVAASDPRVAYSSVAIQTELKRELFASSEGALIDQSFAYTQGMLYIVAVADGVSQELYDVLGHQRGWEIMADGVRDAYTDLPDFRTFCLDLARDAVELTGAPPLPSTAGEVVVVTDPHYNALVAHEIVGHAVELDRALKLEIAYAGRSWLLRSLADTEVGKRVASDLVSAFSDPGLPGYGHYAFDHEGTPGRRVVHIDGGIFRGFMNSRQTAAIVGADPNGHFTATDASLVPLIRMSNTVFDRGRDDPRDIVRAVDRGYYLAGHRIPSIAESRENFRISARKVYEIRNGERGRLYRDGSITADSREYLMRVDAVGTDLRLHPIPNCGKGQPMQTKRLGNGGPTMRSRARLLGPT